jgi:hypothetical protein
MQPGALHYLLTQLRNRFATVRSGDLDRGALSLEWVVIAIGLVAAAVALGVFLKGKLSGMEAKIGNG